jgi:hypothetical protein
LNAWPQHVHSGSSALPDHPLDTTETGPTVQAELDTSTYPTGIKISARQLRQVKDQAL